MQTKINNKVDHNSLVIAGNEMKTLLTIRNDGKVTLSENIDLSDLQTLPLDYLRMVREMVNTAIYDNKGSK
jgi:hypothetical protein